MVSVLVSTASLILNFLVNRFRFNPESETCILPFDCSAMYCVSAFRALLVNHCCTTNKATSAITIITMETFNNLKRDVDLIEAIYGNAFGLITAKMAIKQALTEYSFICWDVVN